jgi:hypothetical protein
MVGSSAQAEEGQNEHDHDDQADEIDNAVHGTLLWAGLMGRLPMGTERGGAGLVPQAGSGG